MILFFWPILFRYTAEKKPDISIVFLLLPKNKDCFDNSEELIVKKN